MNIKHILLLIFLVACARTSAKEEKEMKNSEERGKSPVQALLPIQKWKGKEGKGWEQYHKFISEDKYESAIKEAEKILEQAKKQGDGEEQVRALIRIVQLRTALHGYETAVRFLREEPWPQDLIGYLIIRLYYAHSLWNYARMYSWEINKREKVESKGVVDLKSWTMEQIFLEAVRTYAEVFETREQLGDLPASYVTEYISPNTYPEGIRPTLRDSVTYLMVSLLTDSLGWRPDQTNEVFTLDLKALLGMVEKVDLASPDVHPIQKAMWVLSDLEKWHQERGESEAGFEARLMRIKILSNHFNNDKSRELLKSDLEANLIRVKGLPWWSEGMATLADLIRSDDAPDRFIKSREIAMEGYSAFPESIGGKRCYSIIKQIEAPEYSVESMSSDGAEKRSIGVMSKNLQNLYFRAYPMDLKNLIESSDDYNLMPRWDEVERIMKTTAPSHQWEVKLNNIGDYSLHRTWVTPPIKQNGFYIIVTSAQKGFEKKDNVMYAIPIIIGDLVLISRQEQNTLEVIVKSGSTGRPVEGARVYLYRYDYRHKHRSWKDKKTDENGVVTFEKPSENVGHFIYAEKGDDVCLDPSYMYFYAPQHEKERISSLVFTDRSIYRPQQKVMFKVVVYKGNLKDLVFMTSPDISVTAYLKDPNHQIVDQINLKTNRYGTTSGEFVIPKGRPLGEWRIETSAGGQGFFRVEEYKRPTFEVKINDPEKPLRLNEKAELNGEARYYFGLPVTSGKVKWRVEREPIYPYWWDWWWGGGTRTNKQIIASGTGILDNDGAFKVSFTPLADEAQANISKQITYRYTLSVDVTDEGGETRSVSRTFRLGFVAIQASVIQEANFFLEGTKPKFKIIRTDLNGVPSKGIGSYRLLEVDPPKQTLVPSEQPLPEPINRYTTPDDRKRPRWKPDYNPFGVIHLWKNGKELMGGKLEHDDKGEVTLQINPLPKGVYRLVYESEDPYGIKYELTHEFFIVGKQNNIPLPGIFMAESTSVPVGGKIRLFVYSGLKDQEFFIDFFKDGIKKNRKIIKEGMGMEIIEIPVKEEDRGGVGVMCYMVRDHQLLTFVERIFVPWDNKELKIEFSTFRDKLRPGQEEEWIVKVSSLKGQDVGKFAAEILAYMYDRSLDAFVPHNPPTPLSIFPLRNQTGWIKTSLSLSRPIWLDASGFPLIPSYSQPKPDTLIFPSGYGIGGVGYIYPVPDRKRMAPPAAKLMNGGTKKMAVREERADDKTLEAESIPGVPMAGAKEEDVEAHKETVEIRKEFSETAFFFPHLETGDNGSVKIRFKVPDSVTSWNVWIHAITRDLKSGSLKKEVATVKELMVRPYLPRFLREGDKAEIKVVVNNASEREINGYVDFDIIDPETEKSIIDEFGLTSKDVKKKPFTVQSQKGTNLSFPVITPARLGEVAFKVIAYSSDNSDGELRPIPILPGRMHLSQSRFATLKGKDKRTLTFKDIVEAHDPTLINEQMVITLDAQLFYSVLSALPYLVNYPYECTEQTLNRFLSTGILVSLFRQFPQVEKMAKEFSDRKTQFEQWEQEDPNRKMAMEETPWLVEAKGGDKAEKDLIRVLNPDVAKANMNIAITKLKKSQTSSGGFPWFPGGPPSPFITLYVLYGFSKGLEFGLDVPKDMIERAWQYLHRHYIEEWFRVAKEHDCCWEPITFLNYVLSQYPDSSWTKGVFSENDRKEMIDFSFSHWKQHSPMLKGFLALTLKRMGREKDARLVWESVMDSAKTEEDRGTFWAPEDRAWLWYNDTIETHAFAVRTVMEIMPEDRRLDGLVLWLFLNKKLNHWKSTKATAEVIYSLAHYLKKTNALGVREAARVVVGDESKEFIFDPEKYTGKKNQIVLTGDKINAKSATITVEKETPGYMFASATWHFSTEKMPEEERGDFINISRQFYKRVVKGREVVLEPLKEGAKIVLGDEVEIHISIRTKHQMEYVHLRDPRGAGFEPVSQVSRHKWDLGIYWYEEVRDSATNFFFEYLPQGEYTFRYRLKASNIGTFKVAPAFIQPMYAPEFTAYSSGAVITVSGE